MSRNLLAYSMRKLFSLSNGVGARLIIPLSTSVNYCSKPSKSIPGMPKNILEDFNSSSKQPTCGVIYDKKPFKFTCVKGKKYAWCLCGKSKSQPLCDGTHKNPHLKIKHRPVHFAVDEDRDVWLCNCKQTSKRPFCDGTHKREDIQAAIR
ncbi:CDGSH iron-sulfur domain-containing protein 3, mitochondrial isoform X2 [Ischnura elegans]|uniref:CDGSH iron-sulfur domain-containing protein 3, mitochondrial isoform X2 n=1 Tax=Ischnura elegans TaxID=197161 RepID=UPI001ED8A930|nr:CDGSH iron-sulfur domain-containing protein 3, mitochondrial isoform X2 [Ischnura elegans]